MDARPADGERITEGSASPYAHAAARRFTHFSASRSDTRTQFRRWATRDPQPTFRKAAAHFRNEPIDLKALFLSASLSTPDTLGLVQENLQPSVTAPPPSPFGGEALIIPIQEPAPSPRERDCGVEADEEGTEDLAPQWLRPASRQQSPVEGAREGAAAETLAGAAERISSHWPFLEEVFAPRSDATGPFKAPRSAFAVPVLAAFSMAGGTGKTTVLATLCRVLAARGERVLLADTTPLSMAPCYFGARPVAGRLASESARSGPSRRPKAFGSVRSAQNNSGAGPVRTFAPPKGRNAETVDILSLGEMLYAGNSPEGKNDPVHRLLLHHCEKADRLLVDIQSGWEALARRLFWLKPLVLAPLLPDMNSVASVAVVETAFADDLAAGAINLVYLLNQFDPSVPLHLDVRGALERRLGDRLLPFVVRRSPEVSEALAEGMTAIDYAPGSPVAEDYARLADWVIGALPSTSLDARPVRWSEL